MFQLIRSLINLCTEQIVSIAGLTKKHSTLWIFNHRCRWISCFSLENIILAILAFEGILKNWGASDLNVHHLWHILLFSDILHWCHYCNMFSHYHCAGLFFEILLLLCQLHFSGLWIFSSEIDKCFHCLGNKNKKKSPNQEVQLLSSA